MFLDSLVFIAGQNSERERNAGNGPGHNQTQVS